MAKIYLKGAKNLSYFPVTANTASAYTPGTKAALPGLQSLSPSDNRNDYEIYGDDGIYDQGSDYKNTEITATINEMSLANLAALTGATLATNVLDETNVDEAPEVALTFMAQRGDGNYRMYAYYLCKLKSYKVSHKTRASGDTLAAYELTFTCCGRLADGKVRSTKDSAAAADLDWVDTVSAVS